MSGRAWILAFVAGHCIVHGLPALPSQGAILRGLAALLLISLVIIVARRAWATFGEQLADGSRDDRRAGGRRRGRQARRRRQSVGRLLHMLLLLAWALALGVSYASWRAELRLADALAPVNDDRVSRVTLQVVTLPRVDRQSIQFEARVLDARPGGVPSRIMVNWPLAVPAGRPASISSAAGKALALQAAARSPGPSGGGRDAKSVGHGHALSRLPRERQGEWSAPRPGQVWRMALRLRRSWSARNPHGFDQEGHLFARGVRATATVRGKPVLLADHPAASLEVLAERARHAVRAAMLPHLSGQRYGGVLLALAVGDQASIQTGDWQVFNRSGITHLVSISGSHITMIAALGGLSVYWLARRLRWRGRLLAERLPARLPAAWTALAVAWCYCLLAGWGVPARRTFLMLAVVAIAYVLRVPVTGTRIVCLAALFVVLLDPWAVLASGFWLSFGAVAVLLTSTQWRGMAIGLAPPSRMLRWRRAVVAAISLQLAVSVALMPALALKFHEISLVSPLANAYAIPLIGVVVTPLSLLCAAASLIPGAGPVAGVFAAIGHGVLQAVMAPTAWLAALPVASLPAAAAPFWTLPLALAGIALAVAPYGPPLRRAAWLLVLPALCWRAERPPHGDWWLDALDVGQAGAIVVRTASQTLLFDTGGAHHGGIDDGARIVLPFLRAAGVRRLDVLVVSHADSDHAGGLHSVLQGVEVGQSYASFDLPDAVHPAAPARMPVRSARCERGRAWVVDGVEFTFLWPDALPQSRNASSCVLRIRGPHHTALLTGDIGARQERRLIDAGLGGIDVVMAPHHGSASSSSIMLVHATRPAHVIAQAGRWSPHGHPSPYVQRRWEAVGAHFWRTDSDGAISIQSSKGALSAISARARRGTYWGGS